MPQWDWVYGWHLNELRSPGNADATNGVSGYESADAGTRRRPPGEGEAMSGLIPTGGHLRTHAPSAGSRSDFSRVGWADCA